jgi:hypothetical protein
VIIGNTNGLPEIPRLVIRLETGIWLAFEVSDIDPVGVETEDLGEEVP